MLSLRQKRLLGSDHLSFLVDVKDFNQLTTLQARMHAHHQLQTKKKICVILSSTLLIIFVFCLTWEQETKLVVTTPYGEQHHMKNEN